MARWKPYNYIRPLYIGQAGQHAVTAEFLIRGLNAAAPAQDMGDDLLVFEDATGKLSRVQVKTSRGKPLRRKRAFTTQFQIDPVQLRTPKTPDLFYVFAARLPRRWEFVVISRQELHEGIVAAFGTPKNIVIKFNFAKASVHGLRRDLQPYRNNWKRYWPAPPAPSGSGSG